MGAAVAARALPGALTWLYTESANRKNEFCRCKIPNAKVTGAAYNPSRKTVLGFQTFECLAQLRLEPEAAQTQRERTLI